jgi:hypothetical protein
LASLVIGTFEPNSRLMEDVQRYLDLFLWNAFDQRIDSGNPQLDHRGVEARTLSRHVQRIAEGASGPYCREHDSDHDGTVCAKRLEAHDWAGELSVCFAGDAIVACGGVH